MYRSRKPGMDNNVSDIRKEQIPTYVSEERVEGSRSRSSKNHLKRKRDSEIVDAEIDKPEKRASISPLRPWSISP
ncbi:polynucleotide adenylyltransferase [Sarracenia purpurea var. burkii]